MRIENARRVRDLAQEVVQLIDAATARAHRDREAVENIERVLLRARTAIDRYDVDA